VHVGDFAGCSLSAQALKMPPLKVMSIAAYGKCFILQFMPQQYKNVVRTFILAAKGSFVIVITPLAFKNFARLWLAF